MRTNIFTQLQRQIGSNSERGNGAQMSRVLVSLLYLSIESLKSYVWCMLRGIHPLVCTANARANLQGFTGLVTQTLSAAIEVDTPRHVPSLGTDQALRNGLIAG
jgi:hypothetical protein